MCDFGSLNVGEEFFDPRSGEFFEKVGALKAKATSGGDAFEGKDAIFYPEERVERK